MAIEIDCYSAYMGIVLPSVTFRKSGKTKQSEEKLVHSSPGMTLAIDKEIVSKVEASNQIKTFQKRFFRISAFTSNTLLKFLDHHHYQHLFKE